MKKLLVVLFAGFIFTSCTLPETTTSAQWFSIYQLGYGVKDGEIFWAFGAKVNSYGVKKIEIYEVLDSTQKNLVLDIPHDGKVGNIFIDGSPLSEDKLIWLNEPGTTYKTVEVISYNNMNQRSEQRIPLSFSEGTKTTFKALRDKEEN